MPSRPCASIIIILDGACLFSDGQKDLKVGSGSIIFVGAAQEISISRSSGDDMEVLFYRAHANLG